MELCQSRFMENGSWEHIEKNRKGQTTMLFWLVCSIDGLGCCVYFYIPCKQHGGGICLSHGNNWSLCLVEFSNLRTFPAVAVQFNVRGANSVTPATVVTVWDVVGRLSSLSPSGPLLDSEALMPALMSERQLVLLLGMVWRFFWGDLAWLLGPAPKYPYISVLVDLWTWTTIDHIKFLSVYGHYPRGIHVLASVTT